MVRQNCGQPAKRWSGRLLRRSFPRCGAPVLLVAVAAVLCVVFRGAALASPAPVTQVAQGRTQENPEPRGDPGFFGALPETSLQELEEHGVTQPIDKVFEELVRDQDLSWREIVKDVISGKGIDFLGVSKALARSAAGGFLASGSLFGKIMLIGVSVACLEILSLTISPSGSNRVAVWACHISLIILAIMSFNEVLKVARNATEAIRTAFFAFIPALTTLSLVSGAPVTASVLHPLVFGVGTIACVFVLDVAFPLIYTSIVLDLAGNLGGGDRASGVAGMLRQIAFLGTGVFMACFVGIVMGQKAAAGFADGMAFRTAKYVASTFIPIAGKAIGDTMDMFFVSTYGLRTALGLAGCIALLAVVFGPFLQVLGCLVVWKVSAAVLGPVTGNTVQKSLKSMADGITALAVSLFVTSFVFIICLSLVAQAAKPY